MKIAVLLSFLVLSLPFVATAEVGGPYIVKENFSGEVPKEWTRHERCEVYSNKVVISHDYGNGSITTKTEVDFSFGGDIVDAINQAAAETLNRHANKLCDGPSTSISAYAEADQEGITLFATGGCGSDSLQRGGPMSQALIEVVNQFCPTTYESDWAEEPIQD